MRRVEFGCAAAMLAVTLAGQAREAGAEVPYRIYVPAQIAGKSKPPMIVCLQGAGGTPDTLMEWGNGLVKKLAEKHGYIVVTPLEEKDVLRVTEIVAKEHGADRSRVYLLGYAEGGAAAWRLSEKYRQWAGLAVIAGSPLENDYPFEHLRGLPVMISQGGADIPAQLERSRQQVAAMTKLRMAPRYLEVPAATHDSIVTATLPEIFDFFDEDPPK